jgi:DNA-binding MarR family transcriptional regulator
MSTIYHRRTFRMTESVAAHIGRVRKKLIEKIDLELAALDLSTIQSMVIVRLTEGLGSTASDMCRAMTHDPGAMARLLDKLESRGLLRRACDGDDRRSARLALTPKGRALYPKIAAAQANVLNRMLEGFSRGEVRALEDFLKRMLANA